MDALVAELIRKVDEMNATLKKANEQLAEMLRYFNAPASMANVRQCERKAAYHTAKDARTVIRELQKGIRGNKLKDTQRRSPNARELRYYQCPVCQNYHITKRNDL